MPSRTALHEAEASAGAQFVDQAGWEVPRHFGNVEQEYQSAYKRAALFDLGHHGKVEVCGPEAAAFLHNLCTNEIKQLEIGKGCEAFFATLKARVVGHAFIYRARSDDGQDVFFLDTAPGQGESLARHLDHYLISEQAEIKDRTGQFSQLYVAGPQAPALVQQVLGNDFSRLANLEVREAIDHADVKYQVRRHDFLDPQLLGGRAVGDQGLQLDGDAVQGVDHVRGADAVLPRLRCAVYVWWIDGSIPRKPGD